MTEAESWIRKWRKAELEFVHRFLEGQEKQDVLEGLKLTRYFVIHNDGTEIEIK